MDTNNELVIYRNKWLLPETSGADTCLQSSEDEKMCCIGMYAKQRGLKRKDILDVKTLACLDSVKKPATLARLFEGLVQLEFNTAVNTRVANNLMAINDISIGSTYGHVYKSGKEKHILVRSQEHREKLLAAEFAKAGIKVRFEGKLDLLDDKD